MRKFVWPALIGIVVLAVPNAVAAGDSCKSRDVKAIIRKFVRAYNAGDIERLDGLFLKGKASRSYDVHPVERPDGSDRSTLVDYFEERHDYGDSIEEIEGLRTARYDNGNRGFGFSLEFDRVSEELSPFASGHFIVKGSATCDGIYFWNMTWESP